MVALWVFVTLDKLLLIYENCWLCLVVDKKLKTDNLELASYSWPNMYIAQINVHGFEEIMEKNCLSGKQGW